MAPARMVEFMEKHINECEICLTDPDVRFEVKKITTIVLPENKIIKPAKKPKPAVPVAPKPEEPKAEEPKTEEPKAEEAKEEVKPENS